MLTAVFPRTEYAEDLPFPRLILTTHVLHRGFQAGTALGLVAGTLRAAMLAVGPPPPSSTTTGTGTSITNSNSSSNSSTNSKSSSSSVIHRVYRLLVPPRATAATLLTRSAGVGGMVGLGAMAVALPYRMAGAPLIEWQDRSWRLLANAGQVQVDSWSAAGMVLGVTLLLAVAARRRHPIPRVESSGVTTTGTTGTIAATRPGGAGIAPLVRALGWRSVVGSAGLGSLLGVVGYMGWRYGVGTPQVAA